MIGDKLRKLITRKGIKQVELCRRLDISPSRLSNYLNNSREPDLKTLSMIADFLGVDLNYFSPVPFMAARKVVPVKNTRDIGASLLRLREEKGISLEQLASRIGVEDTAIARAEQGFGELSPEFIEAVAGQLGGGVFDAVGIEDDLDMDRIPGTTGGLVYIPVYDGLDGLVAEKKKRYGKVESGGTMPTSLDMLGGMSVADGSLFWVRATDDDLAPRIRKGDMVLLAMATKTSLDSGDLVITRTGTDVRLMRAYDSGNGLLLVPELDKKEPVSTTWEKITRDKSMIYRVHWIATRP